MSVLGSVKPAPGPLVQAQALARDIKLAHSVFALPFAILGAFMAARPPAGTIDWPQFGRQLLLIVLAMVFARTAAMLANRVVDRHLDRANPRTARRALPAGLATTRAAIVGIVVASALFLGVCAAFFLLDGNWWPLALGLPVLAWICAYGLLKRRTLLCHLYLGSSLAISPVAAAVAIEPSQIGQLSIWLLAGMVLCWVAGFDVIYALQDVDVDRQQGLHSMPSRLGVRKAMVASRCLHVLAATSLWVIALTDPRSGVLLVVAAALVTALLLVEHLTVARWGTTRIALTFFTLNGLVSCVVGVLGSLDIALW
ncbi:MAG: putative 4-hydroxybenzoate polyprenyltransferase [Phycisphaerales bacterium]|nr:putative 4-hydroxybenzoate polyprenyltransferase [Phycisphaerales bacterium]